MASYTLFSGRTPSWGKLLRKKSLNFESEKTQEEVTTLSNTTGCSEARGHK